MQKIDAKELQAELAEKFITMLESGGLPAWRQTWKTSGGSRRAGDGYLYAGINQLNLMFISSQLGWPSIWATAGQWINLAKSRKETYNFAGQRAQACILRPNMHKFDVDDAKAPNGKKTVVIVKSYSAYPVLNIAQVQGTEKLLESMSIGGGAKAIDTAESFIAAQGADIRHGGAEAFYAPQGDYITLPVMGDFETSESYYATAFHELIHWTGAEKRLNREGVAKFSGFGSPEYCYEELIAEFGACMTGAALGVSGEHVNHASYIASWVKRLREKPSVLTRASTDAYKAFASLAKAAGLSLGGETDEKAA